jgi:hypothetical protein
VKWEINSQFAPDSPLGAFFRLVTDALYSLYKDEGRVRVKCRYDIELFWNEWRLLRIFVDEGGGVGVSQAVQLQAAGVRPHVVEKSLGAVDLADPRSLDQVMEWVESVLWLRTEA